jgi:hypothetical protein
VYDAGVAGYEDGWVRYTPRGGAPIRLEREYCKTHDGRLHHPGNHPAFAGYIRWGHLQDGRPWVEATSVLGANEWVFDGPDRERAAELAVVELRALRDDGRWETLSPA